MLGYFAAAGGLYWFLYLRQSSRFVIDSTEQTTKAIWQSIHSDVILSVLSSGIFSVCAALMTTVYQLGYTRLYLQPEQYGLGYLGFSLVLVLILQDTYFYFTHRLSHHPRCYRWLHQGHHHSKNPTPWTAFAFDPAEAMVQAIYLVGVTMVIPMHLSVLIAVVLVMTLGALIHHFGLRLFKASAMGNWLGSWLVGPTHHWLHHRKYTVHYSLYFTFWDRVLGTQHPGYEDVLSPSVAEKKIVPSANIETAPAALSGKTVPFPLPFKKAS
ncbi:sterol desaturase family protein [Leptolyngbya sp. BC1307]|uniref:sterol desaturase family protein n=1 Tax=Leptolyngbya sp. BC1307 TaxID=2029589 RepID=UPI001F0A18C2|nr:sterol desaturase family protein [Leptolyngbya sp. BC1307]